ncbi:tetratricopeptide repeat protein, partial [bacterium]|nr:tetratricopeptide repeat protein [bacterium]
MNLIKRFARLKVTSENADEFVSLAYELIENEEFNSAIKLAKQISKTYSAGYEIHALALSKAGKNRAAIRILKRGLEKSPKVWLLWQLLANLLSDENKYDQALKSYQRAKDCEHVDQYSVNLNIAILYGRTKQYDLALKLLKDSENPYYIQR